MTRSLFLIPPSKHKIDGHTFLTMTFPKQQLRFWSNGPRRPYRICPVAIGVAGAKKHTRGKKRCCHHVGRITSLSFLIFEWYSEPCAQKSEFRIGFITSHHLAVAACFIKPISTAISNHNLALIYTKDALHDNIAIILLCLNLPQISDTSSCSTEPRKSIPPDRGVKIRASTVSFVLKQGTR